MIQLFLLFLLALQPIDPLAEARAALAGGNLEQAEILVRRSLESSPNNAEALFLLGGIQARQRQFQGAEASFMQAIALNPQLAEAYLVLATLYQNQGRLSEAATVLEKGAAVLTDSSEVRYQLANLYLANQELEKALRHLMQISPEQAPDKYWDKLGQTYLLLGRLGEADNALQKFLERNAKSVRTLRTLSAVALRSGDSSRAWSYIAKARRHAPNSTQVLIDFARISMIENLVGEAAAALQYLLLMEPDHPRALFELGSAFIHFANFERSQELFERYLALNPEDPEGHAMLGYSLYLGSKYEEAEPHFFKALALDPTLLDATYYLGMIAFSRNNQEKAEGLLREVASKSPEHGRAHLGLGKLYLRQRRLKEASVELEKAAHSMPTDFEVHFQLSRVYGALGDRDRAAREVQLYETYRDEKEKREADARRTPYSDFGRKTPN